MTEWPMLSRFDLTGILSQPLDGGCGLGGEECRAEVGPRGAVRPSVVSPVLATVHDLLDGPGRGARVRVGLVMRGLAFSD